MSVIYPSARYSRRDEMRQYAHTLEELGHEVPARWLIGDHEWTTDVAGDRDRALALDDFEDVRSADVVIAFTEAPAPGGRNRGGRHVEFGLALAWRKRVMVVGPLENVFHLLPEVEHFETWQDALKSILMWGRR